MDESEMVPNLDGCARFEPNAFKKEKCKHCGRLWSEHKGVIDRNFVEHFTKAKRKGVEDKQKAEDVVKAKAAAKKASLKKQDQAVEDEWLFDTAKDGKGAADEESDDDMGFRMYSQADLQSATAGAGAAGARAPLKVVNLIDFGECDVPHGEELSGGATGSTSTGGSGSARGASAAPTDSSKLSRPQAVPGLGAVGIPPAPSAPEVFGANASMHGGGGEDISLMRTENGRLRDEIDYLQQMLANANDEKKIQVEIINDELEEKKRLIEELRRQKAELEASLRVAQELADAAFITAQAQAQDALETQRRTSEMSVSRTLSGRGEAEVAAALRELRVSAERHLDELRRRVRRPTEVATEAASAPIVHAV